MGKICGQHSSYCGIFFGRGCDCANAQQRDRPRVRVLSHDINETFEQVNAATRQQLDEEDGPWAEGWGTRAGEPAHAAWFKKNLHMIEMLEPQDVWVAWAEEMKKYTSGCECEFCHYRFDPSRRAQGYTQCLARVDGVASQAMSPPRPAKADHLKPKPYQFFVLQFPLGFLAVAKHMEAGCDDPGHVFLGWREVEDGFRRYTDAMIRHLLEGEDVPMNRLGYDRSKTEEQHAIATAANAMIRLELLLRKRRNLNLDARPAGVV